MRWRKSSMRRKSECFRSLRPSLFGDLPWEGDNMMKFLLRALADCGLLCFWSVLGGIGFPSSTGFVSWALGISSFHVVRQSIPYMKLRIFNDLWCLKIYTCCALFEKRWTNANKTCHRLHEAFGFFCLDKVPVLNSVLIFCKDTFSFEFEFLVVYGDDSSFHTFVGSYAFTSTQYTLVQTYCKLLLIALICLPCLQKMRQHGLWAHGGSIAGATCRPAFSIWLKSCYKIFFSSIIVAFWQIFTFGSGHGRLWDEKKFFRLKLSTRIWSIRPERFSYDVAPRCISGWKP